MSTLTVSRNATLRPAEPDLIPPSRRWSGQDAQTEAWATSRTSRIVTREALHERTSRALTLAVKGSSEGCISLHTYVASLSVLDELIFDNAPTPQLSADKEGFLEATWLVSEQSLTFIVAPDGEASLRGTDANGDEVLAGEFRWPDFDKALVRRARALLRDMSPRVEHRL